MVKKNGIIEFIVWLKTSSNFTQEEKKEIIDLTESTNLPLKLNAIEALSKIEGEDVEKVLFQLFLSQERSSFFVVTETIVKKKCLLEELTALLFDVDYPSSLRKNALYVILRVYFENDSLKMKIRNLFERDYNYASSNIKEEVLKWLLEFGYEKEEFLTVFSSTTTNDSQPKDYVSNSVSSKRISFFINKLTLHDLDLSSKLSFYLAEEDWDNIIVLCKNKLAREFNPKVISIILKLLGELKREEVLEIIKPYLSSGDDRVRADAVEALCQQKDERIIPWILPLIEDSDNRVRANVAGCLWSYGGLRALSILKEMIETGSTMMKRSAVYMLGELKTIQALDILEEVLFNEPEYLVKLQAVKAMEKIIDPQVSIILGKYLKEKTDDKFSELKLEIVRVLAKMGDEEAVKVLTELSQYKNLPLYLREEIDFQLNLLMKGGN